jgi:hypothetical protein
VKKISTGGEPEVSHSDLRIAVDSSDGKLEISDNLIVTRIIDLLCVPVAILAESGETKPANWLSTPQNQQNGGNKHRRNRTQEFISVNDMAKVKDLHSAAGIRVSPTASAK